MDVKQTHGIESLVLQGAGGDAVSRPLAVPTPASPLVVSDYETLHSVATLHSFRTGRPVVIALPGLSTSEAEAASAVINRYRNECGCSIGATSAVAAFLVVVLWLAVSWGVFTSGFLLRLPLAFAFALICAGAGKSIGLLVAARRLRLEVDRLYARSRFWS